MSRCVLCAARDAGGRVPVGEPCVGCGQAACSAHRWAMLGLCLECATEDEVRAHLNAQRKSPREVLELVKWID